MALFIARKCIPYIMNERKSETKISLKTKYNTSIKEQNEFHKFIDDKIQYLQEIIRNTILSIKKNKEYEIFSNNDANLSISVLTDLYEKTTAISTLLSTTNNGKNNDKIIDALQKVIDKLSMIICGFGTKHIEDLLFISFGSEFKNMKIDNVVIKEKYEIIKKHIQPIGYKIVHWKPQKSENTLNAAICSDKITDDTINIDDANMFECFDIEKTTKSFFQKIYGIQVVIQNEKARKKLIINGIVEDMNLE